MQSQKVKKESPYKNGNIRVQTKVGNNPSSPNLVLAFTMVDYIRFCCILNIMLPLQLNVYTVPPKGSIKFAP